MSTVLAVALGGLGMLAAGCAGPEAKLGRGINNVTEFARMGELRRSVEQTAIWQSPDAAYTKGLIRGINMSVARTLLGVYEIATFPIPSYRPSFTNILAPNPVYPDNYKPRLLADPTFGSDAALGFSGGDVFPYIPGSRFKIFDN